jgi:hypothetical protein
MTTKTRLERALGAIDEFRRQLEETPPDELECLELEREIRRRVNAIGLELMRAVIQRADTKEPEVLIDGKRWGNRRESPGEYTTLFGDLKEPRSIYSQPGGGPVAVPVNARLGIIEGRYTPQVARVLTRTMGLMPAKEGAAMLKEVGVAQLSESTLRRVPKAIAARYETRRERITRALREEEEVPDEAVTVQVSLDGVMVPMDGEDAKRRGRKTDDPQLARHELRYGPVNGSGPADDDEIAGRAWHEAMVATLSYWDRDGEHLRTVYLGRMPESGRGTIADELEEELKIALKRRPDLHVQFACDGNPNLWSLLERMSVRLPVEHHGEIGYLLDYYHAAQYLQDAADAVEGQGTPEARVLAVSWGETLKEYEDGAARVLKSMRYYRDQVKTSAKREEIQDAVDFLAKQAQNGRLDYAESRAKKRPIGTGVVEAAAKTVVGVRIKRAGSRFEPHGGQTVMVFRTALLSDRFERLSDQLEHTYTARVEAA